MTTTQADTVERVRRDCGAGNGLMRDDVEQVVAEVERLRAALVEERARGIWEGDAGRRYTLDEYRIFARAALITEGLLPSS